MNIVGGQKPAIHIFVHSAVDENEICQLLYGIEEEQVPFAVQSSQSGDALELSYEAAKSSRLEVGVGVCGERNAILHYSKLNKDKPLFQLQLDDPSKSHRALGANAARLVKGIAFKDLEADVEVEEADSNGVHQVRTELDNVTREQIKAIVRRVLAELM